VGQEVSYTYQKRHAEAVAARDRRIAAQSAGRSTERAADLDALTLEINRALGDVTAMFSAQRQATATALIKEHERSAAQIGALRAEITELKAGREDDRKRIAELERRVETASALTTATESQTRRLAAQVTEESARLRDDTIKLGNDLRLRTRDAAAASTVELREQLEAKFLSQLAASEKRADAVEERARAAETGLTELRGSVRSDAIRLFDDLRERMRDAAAARAADLRADVGQKFVALRSELGEKIASLNSRPAFDQGQIDRAVETGVARTGIAMRAEFDRALEARLEEKGLAFEARVADFEGRAEIAEQRARALEAAIPELRQQVRDDAIRAADDLRARVRDALAAATVELRSEMEPKFASRLAEAKNRAERAEERARALEIAMMELRGAVRDDVATVSGDLRQQARDTAVATVAELRTEIQAKIAAVTERPGKMSIAKTYEPGAVIYRGDLVVHSGATWQAKCDTAQTPGGSDYVSVARAGRDGADGRSLTLRGPYDMQAKYTNLDIVEFGGELFVALRDDPALCPGEGWRLLAPRGKAGERGGSGPRGLKGDRGPTGAKIHSWQLDRERYRVSPLMEDGTVGPMLELRGLFEQYQIETSD
jgi:hypothetical protein